MLLIAAPRLGTPAHHHGAILGAAAGTLFGVSDVAVKALTSVGGPLELLTSPWLPVAALASVLAFLASARGFQEGEAVPVIACTSTAANITVITGGIVVFGDALAGGALLRVQIVAFALVAVAALVTPARASRHRVAGTQPAPMRRARHPLPPPGLRRPRAGRAAPAGEGAAGFALAGDTVLLSRVSGRTLTVDALPGGRVFSYTRPRARCRAAASPPPRSARR